MGLGDWTAAKKCSDTEGFELLYGIGALTGFKQKRVMTKFRF